MTYQIHLGSNLDVLPTLPDNSVDSIVTDPPYGLSDNKFVAETITRWIKGERDFIPDGKGFMGKAWDAFVPPPALWDECFRVLKPGGHLLAFFGSRTQDIGALSIRLAGFEIRDSIAWMYGSGFPKSLDISKAIDKAAGENKQRQLKFVNWMKSTGMTASQANKILQEAGIISANGTMAGHFFSHSQAAIATAEIFDCLKPHLPKVPEEIERLVAERTGIEWTAYRNREVIGQKTSGIANKEEKDRHTIGASKSVEVNITAPSTPEAQQWEGWGTALKPAFEPIVVARKPLIGTVAENVLTHGTGGLNIDGSRIGTSGGGTTCTDRDQAGNCIGHQNANTSLGGGIMRHGAKYEAGRWPSNVILDPYTAELLDEQSDASRFFYVAKASRRDRNEGLEELEPQRHSDRENAEGVGGDNPRNRTNNARQNFHPTVKPTDLMRYLVKLVTPPGGVVLDPFTGSGSTGKAAILEGFDFIGIELTEEYLPIIEGRLAHAERLATEAKAKEDEALF